MLLLNQIVAYYAHVVLFICYKYTIKYLIIKYLSLNLIALRRPCDDGMNYFLACKESSFFLVLGSSFMACAFS